MTLVRCPLCGQMVDTADELTLYSHHTGRYYHHMCRREYGTEMSYIRREPVARPVPFVKRLVVTSPRGQA